MAQSVERRIGSAEVTGSIPVGSLKRSSFSRPFLFYINKKIQIITDILTNYEKIVKYKKNSKKIMQSTIYCAILYVYN